MAAQLADAPIPAIAQPAVQALARDHFVASFLDQSPRSSMRLIPTSAFIAYL